MPRENGYDWRNDAEYVRRQREAQKRADARAAMRAAELARQQAPRREPAGQGCVTFLLVLLTLGFLVLMGSWTVDAHQKAARWEAYEQADSAYFAGQDAAKDAWWACHKRSRHDFPRDCDDLREAYDTYSQTHARPALPFD